MNERPPLDPAAHAIDFGRRWSDGFDRYAALRMEELGVPPGQIGASDHERGVPWRAFFPDESQGGGVAPGKRLNLDSGILNPARLDHMGSRVAHAWAHARLRDRIDAVLAHEWEEAERRDHLDAAEHAPETALPISEAARVLLRILREAERER
jgi:hypothetical protein